MFGEGERALAELLFMQCPSVIQLRKCSTSHECIVIFGRKAALTRSPQAPNIRSLALPMVMTLFVESDLNMAT